AERLVGLVVSENGENHTNTADAVHLWAWLVQQNGDYQKAEELWLRALAIDETLFGKDSLETTRRLHLLSTVYIDERDAQRAAPLLERSLRIREKHLGSEHHETAQI